MNNCFIFLLLVIIIPLPLFSQKVPAVYHLDRTPEGRVCHLPEIYFKANTAELEAASIEDMEFLAFLMHKYRKLSIKIKTSISPHANDATHKLLTEERLSYFTWMMGSRFGIPTKRIIRDDYRELSRGYSPDQSNLSLDRRRLECDCVWDRKRKKR